MRDEEKPYIGECSFCGNGLLRFYRCHTCDRIVALCDECELMWENIEQVSRDPELPSDSAYPQCPACGDGQATWSIASVEDIEDAGLEKCLAGDSI